jgi:hypothetical protein
MHNRKPSSWKLAIQTGLIAGAIAVLLSLVGMVVAFSGRWIIDDVFTMAHVIFLAPSLLMAYSVIRRTSPESNRNVILTGLLTGLAGGVVLAALLVIGSLINLHVHQRFSSPVQSTYLWQGFCIGCGVTGPCEHNCGWTGRRGFPPPHTRPHGDHSGSALGDLGRTLKRPDHYSNDSLGTPGWNI